MKKVTLILLLGLFGTSLGIQKQENYQEYLPHTKQGTSIYAKATAYMVSLLYNLN